jgi:hypothetical protein
LVALAACDAAAPTTKAPERPIALRNERPEAVRWNSAISAFEVAGKPLRAAKLWTFDGSTEGFTTAGGETMLAEGAGLKVRLATPILRSPRGLAVDGSLYSLVLVRLTRVAGGGGWNGALYYVTPAHQESGAYFSKPILGADPAPGETTILVYDMAHPTVGGEDWTLSLIDQIRLDLQDGPGGEFVVHQVAIAERADLSALTPPEP